MRYTLAIIFCVVCMGLVGKMDYEDQVRIDCYNKNMNYDGNGECK